MTQSTGIVEALDSSVVAPPEQVAANLMKAVLSPPTTAVVVGEQEGRDKLKWFLAHAIDHMHKEKVIALPDTHDYGAWGKALRRLYENSTEFKDALADTMISMMDGDTEAIEISQVQLLQWLDETGGYGVGGYDDVQAWLMAHLEAGPEKGRRQSGSWYEKARIVTHLIPFCKQNLADKVPPTFFYNTALLNKLRAALPMLVGSHHAPGVIRSEDMSLEEKKGHVLRVLHMATKATSREHLRRELYDQEDIKPLPAYIHTEKYHYHTGYSRELCIKIPTGTIGDAWISSLARRLGNMIEMEDQDGDNDD